MVSDRNMVSIKARTHLELKQLGKMGDTMDDVIYRLIKFAKRHDHLWNKWTKELYEKELEEEYRKIKNKD